MVSPDGDDWHLPGGRPEIHEGWRQTLEREVLEEACATTVRARLLGYAKGVCQSGHEEGLVLVRALWRANVLLDPWEPRHEMSHRMVVGAPELETHLRLATHPFASIVRRMIHEAGC